VALDCSRRELIFEPILLLAISCFEVHIAIHFAVVPLGRRRADRYQPNKR
jgi:hypothetical protein